MIQLLGHELLSRIALTLMHFLWQGVAIGAVAAIAAFVLRRSSASSRYALYTVALLCLPTCVAITFATVETPGAWRDFGAEVAGQAGSRLISKAPGVPTDEIASSDLPQPNTFDDLHSPSVHNDRLASNEPVATEGQAAVLDKRADATSPPLLARLSPAIVLAYVAGASLFLLRLLAGTWGGHRLRVASTPIDNPTLLKLVAEQSRKVGLRIIPAVAVCDRVAVPMVVGVLRPVVLVPASIVTGLAPEQFAAIISHELAHIRRFDLLMNLLQRLIESLLFFHPIVWYLSRRMSAEREACCDDLVVSSGYAQMDYAGALLRMAELCSPAAGQPGAIAVAASGHNATQFELRIQRLMNTRGESRLRLTRAGVIMIALLMISVAVTPAAFRDWAQAQDEGRRKQAEASAVDSELQEATETETARQAASSEADEPEQQTAAPGDKSGGLRSPKVRKAIAKGAKFLETTQRDDGSWRIGATDWQNDGATALCALALLRAGRTTEDESLKQAVDYLVTVEPEHTYTISLQTILFCELDPEKYFAHVRRNVKRLIDSQTRGGIASGGWSYSARSARSDSSNTRFAVWALDVARRVGVEVPIDTWHSVADYWLSLQRDAGSWPYQASGISGSTNMTLAGIASVSTARTFVPEENEERRQEIDASIRRAWKWHDERMSVLKRWRTIPFRFYGLQSLALAGEKTNRATSGDWYPKMSALLLREQDQATGCWIGTGPEGPAIATSLAILALTEGAADGNQDQAPATGSPDKQPENERRKQTLDGGQVNVLLVDRTPRWSFRYLRNVLQRDETIEVKSVLTDAAELPNTLPRFLDYDVIVLGDVELASFGRNNIENIKRFVRDYGRALILIAGDTHLPWSYTDSPLAPLFPIDLKTTSRPEDAMVQPIVPQRMRELPMFQLGKDEDASADLVQNLPKLSVKAVVNDLKTGAEVWTSSSNGEDQMPLIARWKYGIGDVVFLATDETWRWRTTNDGEDFHENFWTKTIRYLAPPTQDADEPAENIVELDADKLKALRVKHFLEALTDKNIEPIWGEAVNGLQAGVVGIRDGQRFQPGASLRFALLLKNASKETIRFEYQWPENCFWIGPSVETRDGERVRVVAVNFRGGHKHFTETLDPDEVSLVMLQGMLGLGEKGRSTKSSPYIENPQPGKYRLSPGIYPYLVDSDGKRRGKAFFLASGLVNFEITEEDEAHPQPPASRDDVRSRIELYEKSFRLQKELANGLPTTRAGIERVFQRALGRKPTEDELSTTLKSVLKLLSKDPQLQKRTEITRAMQDWLKTAIESDTEFDKFIREQLDEGAEEGSGGKSSTDQPESEGLPKDDVGVTLPSPSKLSGEWRGEPVSSALKARFRSNQDI